MKRSLLRVAVGLGIVVYGWASPSTATITIVATSNIGSPLTPEVHLYQLGSATDLWPSGHIQVARDIPFGYYEITVSAPGFRPYTRDLEVINENTDIRAVLSPSGEAVGSVELKGRVLHSKHDGAVWVVVFPLAGKPSDTTESRVDAAGNFAISTAHMGPYLLAVVQGDIVLESQSVWIRFENQDLTIDLGK